MKRVFGILSLGVLMASANVSFAQDQPVKDKIEKQPRVVHADQKQHQKWTPEQKQKFMEERKSAFVKELDLTEKEADKYFQIQKDFRTKVQKLQEERKSIREALKTADQLNDKELKKNLDRLNVIDVEMAKLKADKFDKEVSAIGVRKTTKAQELMKPRMKQAPKEMKRGTHTKAEFKRGEFKKGQDGAQHHRVRPMLKEGKTPVERPAEQK